MISALNIDGANAIQIPAIVDYQADNSILSRLESSKVSLRDVTVSGILSSEGYYSFLNYIEWLGFIDERNSIILSAKHHYYYDPEELKDVNTIINLKELNQIKKIRNFLNSVSHTLQQSCNFIGYFSEKKQHISFSSKINSSDAKAREFLPMNPFLSLVYNIMDSRMNNYMTKDNVRLLLEEYRFKVLDMTDLKGLTYFHAQVA